MTEARRCDGVVTASAVFGVGPTNDLIFPELDRDDPAFPKIVEQLVRMNFAGLEIGDAELRIATALGRASLREPQLNFGQPKATPESVVYYARRGRLIKIGTTVALSARLRVLMPDELLAVEPGDRATESARHAQFAWLAVGREHFEDDPELRTHIAAVVAEHGAPNIAYEPLTTI